MEWCITSLEQLNNLTRKMGGACRGGEVFALSGPLGVGKTEFTKGLAEGLGVVREEVTSPTFSLLQEYSGSGLGLVHFDFYRLECEQEVIELGWEELYESEGSVIVVEWADLFPALFPSHTKWFSLRMEEGKRFLSDVLKTI